MDDRRSATNHCSATHHPALNPPSRRQCRPLRAVAALLFAGCGAASPADETAPLIFTDADLQLLATSDSLAVVEERAWGVLRDALDVPSIAWVAL